MKRTVRAGVAALAFTALAAQPIAANATPSLAASAAAGAHHWLWPAYAVSVVACAALVASDKRRGAYAANERPGLLCLVPVVGLAAAAARHHQTSPKY
jgi:hypothetical protein